MPALDVLAALRRTDLFASVDDKALKNIVQQARVVNHVEGKEIAAEGGDGAGFHLIASGTAAVSIRGVAKGELGPGDYFGEIALIDGKTRSATVVATSPLTTVALATWNFRPILEEEPGVAVALLKVLCARLRAAESV